MYTKKYKKYNNSGNKSQYKPIITIDGRKWYSKFVKNEYHTALEDQVDSYKIQNSLIIGLDSPDYGRRFALFKDYLELYKYMQYLECTNFTGGNVDPPAFFECIVGDRAQKPHFDIELEKDKFEDEYPDLVDQFEAVGEQIVRHVVEQICVIIPEIVIKKDILIYSSHGLNKHGIPKRSYHIVVNNHCHIDNEEAKAFYDKVVAGIKHFTEYVDWQVYSKFQQYRLLGCEKHGSGRPKIFHETFTIGDKTYKHVYSDPSVSKNMCMFMESLVGFVSLCNLLPNYKPIEDKGNFESEEISSDEAQRAFDLLPPDLKKCFKIAKVDTLVHMTRNEERGRLMSNYCDMCFEHNGKPKLHEGIPPFLGIYNGRVFYYCGRNKEGKKKYLGNISTGENGDGSIVEGTRREEEEEDDIQCDFDLDEFEDMDTEVKKRLGCDEDEDSGMLATKESKDSKLRAQFPKGILKDHSIRDQSTFSKDIVKTDDDKPKRNTVSSSTNSVGRSSVRRIVATKGSEILKTKDRVESTHDLANMSLPKIDLRRKNKIRY